jgi:hypothetical protein
MQYKKQVITGIKLSDSVWKKRIRDTLLELNIIPSAFTGKMVISLKEGEVSYIEKTETLK